MRQEFNYKYETGITLPIINPLNILLDFLDKDKLPKIKNWLLDILVVSTNASYREEFTNEILKDKLRDLATASRYITMDDINTETFVKVLVKTINEYSAFLLVHNAPITYEHEIVMLDSSNIVVGKIKK